MCFKTFQRCLILSPLLTNKMFLFQKRSRMSNSRAGQYYPISNRRYRIREKIFSIGDNFTIKDEADQPVFTVRSKLLSPGDQLVLEDMAGK